MTAVLERDERRNGNGNRAVIIPSSKVSGGEYQKMSTILGRYVRVKLNLHFM